MICKSSHELSNKTIITESWIQGSFLSSSKPKFFFPGCGFIGRNLLQYLVENMLVSKVIVVDKAMPQTSWLNKKHLALFENALVEYRSANLINMASCERAFAETEAFEFVINLVSLKVKSS